MNDPLAVLIRLKRWQLDEQSRALAHAKNRLSALNEARSGLVNALAAEAAAAADDVDALAAWAAFAARSRAEIARQDERIASANGQAQAERQRLSQALAAVKRLEVVAARRAAARQTERERQAQAAMDEAAQRRR
jgi:flagellar export protein FliJ